VSDLSRLLGDVYGASTPPSSDDTEPTDATAPTGPPAAADDPPAPPVEASGVEAAEVRPAAPSWADEEVLDEAFADWVPGPPADASQEERGILDDVEPAETVGESIDIDAWLVDEGAADATGPVAAATTSGDDDVLEAHVETVLEESHWDRTSDDLLPSGRRVRRLGLRR
jgi:hypothetical protein